MRRSVGQLFKTITVWGGGTMGGGIAQTNAQAGIPVTVVEVSQDRCDASRKVIEKSLARIGKKKFEGNQEQIDSYVRDALSKITFTTDEASAAASADMILEAIVEDIEVKKALWKKLDGLAPKECVFCTNTSSLSVASQAAATSRPDRFTGMHFFSPVPLMKLVEVVQTDAVSKDVVEKVREHAIAMGKVAVVANDTPGFIVNRLLIPYMMEACRLAERGVASIEDIDVGMKLGCGYPMGPFTLADSVGIDVLKFIMDGWSKQYPDDPTFAPVRLFDEKVAEGKLGVKTGEGFYKYDKK